MSTIGHPLVDQSDRRWKYLEPMPSRIQGRGMISTVVTDCQTSGFCPVIRVLTRQRGGQNLRITQVRKCLPAAVFPQKCASVSCNGQFTNSDISALLTPWTRGGQSHNVCSSSCRSISPFEFADTEEPTACREPTIIRFATSRKYLIYAYRDSMSVRKTPESSGQSGGTNGLLPGLQSPHSGPGTCASRGR